MTGESEGEPEEWEEPDQPVARRERRARLLARMYEALDQKLQGIEERGACAGETGSQAGGLGPVDSERDTRTLNSLARLFEKLTGLDDALAASGNGTPSLAQSEIDAEQLRRDIADRLARLRARQDGNGSA